MAKCEYVSGTPCDYNLTRASPVEGCKSAEAFPEESMRAKIVLETLGNYQDTFTHWPRYLYGETLYVDFL